MKGNFPPKGKVNNRVAGKRADFFQQGFKLPRFHIVPPFRNSAACAACFACADRLRPGTPCAVLGTAAVNLYRIKSGQGSEDFRLFGDNAFNGGGIRYFSRRAFGKTPQKKQVPRGVGAKAQAVAAQINRGNFGLNIESVNVFLNDGKQGVPSRRPAVAVAEDFGKDGGGSRRKQFRGKAVGPAVGVGIFGGVTDMPFRELPREFGIKEGTVGPGKITEVETLGMGGNSLKQGLHRPGIPFLEADSRRNGRKIPF